MCMLFIYALAEYNALVHICLLDGINTYIAGCSYIQDIPICLLDVNVHTCLLDGPTNAC